MIKQRFSSQGTGVECEWTLVELLDKDNKIVFSRTCEFPKTWSHNARVITASKYFTNEENSIHQLIDRVVNTITKAGIKQGVLSEILKDDAFFRELYHILLNQLASFNSPVYFNIGVPNRPQQASACFLLDVEDNMNSILDWVKTEALIFKGGSGSGVNISKLRAKGESINPRGTSSGPLSFMAAADAMAGTIKSGSVARRAAKMVIMDVDHPDIEDFIGCKQKAEGILRKFNELGEDIDVNSDILNYIPYQNANNSVSVTDFFMEAVKQNDFVNLKYRNEIAIKPVRAKDLFHKIAKTAWACGDPGLFYYDNINKWNTCKTSGPIITSNPCCEYLFQTWTPCNLASINLLKFLGFNDNGPFFKIDDFIHTVQVMITAMDILCEYSDYPIPKIGEEAGKYRTLGLGYANLGALIMSCGLPYDSDKGRNIAASITSLMTSVAYWQSHLLAEKVGSFHEFERNKTSFTDTMYHHEKEHEQRLEDNFTYDNPITNFASIVGNAGNYWSKVSNVETFRNAQVTLLAPTGTIAFMMDCDTTGIEPVLSLRTQKKLVGGGIITQVSNIDTALKVLGYNKDESDQIVNQVLIKGHLGDCFNLKKEHLPVFDCAFGTNSIEPMGHVKMVAAVQPFLSSGISKTINMPSNSTVEDVEDVYMKAWELGIKAISIYRDGSKVAQPVKAIEDVKVNDISVQNDYKPMPIRNRLPDTRNSITHKFSVGGHEGYITAGLYDDGRPGEVFVTVSKEGSTISGLLDAFATSVSLCLQHNVPLQAMVDKFKYMKFDPSGFTGNAEIPAANSIIDYIFKWLELTFVTKIKSNYHIPIEDFMMSVTPVFSQLQQEIIKSASASVTYNGDLCSNCGSIMHITGSCKTCMGCGNNTGCG